VLQCVAVCCSVMQCFAMCCSVDREPSHTIATFKRTVSFCLEHLVHSCVAVCCSVLPCGGVCCSVLQCVLESVMQYVTVCCGSLYIRTLPFGRTLLFGLGYFVHSRAATCCSVMQCDVV